MGLLSLIIILLSGFICGLLFERLKLPKIIGMIIIGILIGPSFLNIVDEDRELAIGLRKTDTELAELLNDALATVTGEMVTTWMNLAVSRSSDNN